MNKKILLIFATTATLLVMGVGCKNLDTNRQEEGRDNISEEASNEIGEITKKDTDELFEAKFKLALQGFPGTNAGEVFRDPQNKNKFYFVTNATVVANMPNNDGAGIYVYDLTKDKTYQENGTINVKEGSTELFYKMISPQKVLIGIGVLENKFGFELAARGYSLPKESCDSPWIYGMNLEYLDLGVPNPTPQVFILSKDLEKAEQQKTADCQKALLENTSPVTTTSDPSSEPRILIAAETDASWKIYTSPSFGFTVMTPTRGKYAPDWEMKNFNLNDPNVSNGCYHSNRYQESTEGGSFGITQDQIKFCQTSTENNGAGQHNVIDDYATTIGTRVVVIEFTKSVVPTDLYKEMGCAEKPTEQYFTSAKYCIPFIESEYQAMLDGIVGTFKMNAIIQ